MQQNYSTHRFLTGLLTGLLTLCLALPALAGVSARLDRNEVYAGDPVTLIIESDGRQSGEPDLAPLDKDFNVLGTSTSTRVSIVNGRRSDKTSWTVQLDPRHPGKFRIPPVKVGGEQTQALELTVSDVPGQVTARQSGHLFIEAEADKSGPVYVQQQIPYTVRLYYDDSVLSGDLQAPQPEHAVVEQLGEDKHYGVQRNGRSYQVIERHYAISPEQSGELRIPPVVFGGRMASAQKAGGQRSLHDSVIDRFFRNSPFAGDPFFSNTPFADSGEPVRIHSKAITVEVQPRPAASGDTWLPSDQITLEDSWATDPPQLRVGEPVTRTITLQANGLTGAQLPALQPGQPEQTRLYPETPVNESRTDGDRVYGISRQTFTYIPGKSGSLAVPAVELNWWNTHTNQAATARLPGWEITVEPGTGGSQTPVAQAPATAAPENQIETTSAQDLHPDKPPLQDQADTTGVRPWLIAGGVLLLLAVAVAVKLLRRARPATTEETRQPPAKRNARGLTKDLMQQLARACDAGDARAAARILLELGSVRWPDTPPRNLSSLAALLGHGQAQIMALDRALYAAEDATWNGADLQRVVKAAWAQDPDGGKTIADGLDPLYPENI